MSYFKRVITFIVLLLPAVGYSQNSILSLGLWNLTALSGEVKVGGLYGIGDINTYGINNKITTADYYGGIFVKTNSYIWDPSFLTINVDGGYYPESRQDLYLVSPNIYNAINTSKLHLGATLFPKKTITLTTFLNYDNSYDSRENLTDIKTDSKTYGGTLSYRNNFLPLTIAYNNSNWFSKEVLTGREYLYDQKNLNARISKSFWKRDKNDWLYTHNDYYSRDYYLNAIRNVSDNIQLQDGYFLDSAGRSQYNSNIYGTNQHGSDSFKQFRANENFLYKLPYNLTFNSTYDYGYLAQNFEKMQQNAFSSRLSHQLFESLHSGISYEYNNNLETSYHEINDKAGIDLNYTKKTFANGVLSIMYSYNKEFEKMMSSDALLNIANEEYTLSDLVMIKRPYVNTSSIQIKDATGTIIYQLGLDYVLTTIGNYTEIQRIPGGLIPNNANIFVFYSARQPGSYNYNINLNNFTINYSIFSNLLNVYFKTNTAGYSNIHNADALILNYLTENLYGASVKYKSATAGVEYDDYQSNIVPYTMMRYFFTWQGKIKEKFIFSINANLRDYKIPTEVTSRKYGDLNGMFTYSIDNKSKIDINIGYQSQKGEQINLDYYTMRAKYSTVIKKLTFVLGLDAYDRIYLETQKMDYLGAYVQIIKKFKY